MPVAPPIASHLTPASTLVQPLPPQDKFLKFKYDASTVEAGKAFAKSELQREAGLPVDPSVPVFGFIGGWQLGGAGVQAASLLSYLQASVVLVMPRCPVPCAMPRAVCHAAGHVHAGKVEHWLWPAFSLPCWAYLFAAHPSLVQAAWRSRRAWTSCWPPSRSCPRTPTRR